MINAAKRKIIVAEMEMGKIVMAAYDPLKIARQYAHPQIGARALLMERIVVTGTVGYSQGVRMLKMYQFSFAEIMNFRRILRGMISKQVISYPY